MYGSPMFDYVIWIYDHNMSIYGHSQILAWHWWPQGSPSSCRKRDIECDIGQWVVTHAHPESEGFQRKCHIKHWHMCMHIVCASDDVSTGGVAREVLGNASQQTTTVCVHWNARKVGYFRFTIQLFICRQHAERRTGWREQNSDSRYLTGRSWTMKRESVTVKIADIGLGPLRIHCML